MLLSQNINTNTGCKTLQTTAYTTTTHFGSNGLSNSRPSFHKRIIGRSLDLGNYGWLDHRNWWIGFLATPFCRIGISRCSTHECVHFNIIKPLGIITLSKLWWTAQPHVMFYMSLGSITLSMLWLKFQPQVRFCKLLGRIRVPMLWLKSLPKVKLCELLGRVIMCVTTHGASMLLLKRLPKVKLSHQSFYYLTVVAKATAPFDVYCLAFGSSLVKRGMCSCLSRQLLIIYPNMR